MSGNPSDYDRSRLGHSNYYSSSDKKKGKADNADSARPHYSNSYDQHLSAHTSSQHQPSASSSKAKGVERKGQDSQTTTSLQIPHLWENTPSRYQHIGTESFTYSRYPEIIPTANPRSGPGLSAPPHQSSGSREHGSSKSYPAQSIALHTFLSNPPIMLLKRAVDRNTEQTHKLDRPATNPPVDAMSIESPHFPWKFIVRAHPRIGYLSIADLLNGIYKALQEPIRESEYHKLDRAKAKAVDAAYFKRIDQEGVRSNEKKEPVRRIDWLEGRYLFEGLVHSSNTDHDVWILKLGWPPRYR